MGGLYPAVYAFVSVPYRGATFLNVGVTCYPDPTTGFRPLSGSYISQFIQILHMSMSWGSRFPSPIGELHFSMIDGKDENGNDKSFRPLSGSYISQLFRSKQLTLFQKKVSVPYRGATFLNCGSSVYTDIEFQDCFRPLSGSYISQFFTSRYTTSSRFRPLSGSYISQSWFWLFL